MSICMCIGCGCTDTRACVCEDSGDPCYWLRVDRNEALGVCSECEDLVEAWDSGDRKFRVPVEARHW